LKLTPHSHGTVGEGHGCDQLPASYLGHGSTPPQHMCTQAPLQHWAGHPTPPLPHNPHTHRGTHAPPKPSSHAWAHRNQHVSSLHTLSGPPKIHPTAHKACHQLNSCIELPWHVTLGSTPSTPCQPSTGPSPHLVLANMFLTCGQT